MTSELTLPGTAFGNSFHHAQRSTTFVQGDLHLIVPGIGNGIGTYRVRDSLTAAGDRQYEVKRNLPELFGKSGKLNAAAPIGSYHGLEAVLEPFDTIPYLRTHQRRDAALERIRQYLP